MNVKERLVINVTARNQGEAIRYLQEALVHVSAGKEDKEKPFIFKLYASIDDEGEA